MLDFLIQPRYPVYMATKNIDNPIDIVTELGQKLGGLSRFLDDFTDAFGISLFNEYKIIQRINFLFEHCPTKRDLDIILVSPYERYATLTDTSGSFRDLKVLLLDNAEDGTVYSIRPFETDPEEVYGEVQTIGNARYDHVTHNVHAYWNFIEQKEGISIFYPSSRFHDIYLTRSVASMIMMAANLLGFEKAA